MSAEPVLHQALLPLSWLAGLWSTENGKGIYPTIKDFGYHEQIEFLCIGQPMFNYLATSKHPEKKSPMHQERGFLRVRPETNEVALVVSHNFGMTSIEEGLYDSNKKEIILESASISRMSWAKGPHVKRIKRTLRLIDDCTLEILVFMETEDTDLTEHLRAVYHKL